MKEAETTEHSACAELVEPAEPAEPDTHSPASRIEGVVIGVLLGLREDGTPLIAFPGNPSAECIEARTAASLSRDDIGCTIALLFEGGDPLRPLIMGRIRNPGDVPKQELRPPATVKLDGERLLLTAAEEIVLRCGQASITLTKAGKVLIRGTYLLSRSSGTNRIKGGSVQLN